MKLVSAIVSRLRPTRTGPLATPGTSSEDLQRLFAAYFDEANYLELEAEEDDECSPLLHRAWELTMWMPNDSEWLATAEKPLRTALRGLRGKVDEEQFEAAVTELESLAEASV